MELQGELSLSDDLLLYGTRIVVPKEMRYETLQKIHQRHQGIQHCRLRVKASVWCRGVATIEATEAAASPKKLLLSSVSFISQLYKKSLLPIPRPI